MTIRTAMCREGLGAGLHAGGLIDRGGGLIMCMAIDRGGPNLDQSPVDDRRVLSSTSDTIKAPEKKYRRAEAKNDRERADRRQNAQVRLRARP